MIFQICDVMMIHSSGSIDLEKVGHSILVTILYVGSFVHKIFICFASSFADQLSLFDNRMAREIVEAAIKGVV